MPSSLESTEYGILQILFHFISKTFIFRFSCVQKIVAWTLANTEKLEDSNPKIFMYNGVEYLCKMYSDLDFIVEELNPKLSKHGGFAIG